jgi:hypothetical protein
MLRREGLEESDRFNAHGASNPVVSAGISLRRPLHPPGFSFLVFSVPSVFSVVQIEKEFQQQ